MENGDGLIPRTNFDKVGECHHQFIQRSSTQLQKKTRTSSATTTASVRWLFRSLQHPAVVFLSVFVYVFILSPLPARCEVELDPCAANSTPLCDNNSTCVNNGSDYKCNCSGLEWTGWYCNVSVSRGIEDQSSFVI